MEKELESTEEIDLLELIREYVRHLPIILLVLVLCAGAGYAVSKFFMTPLYQSSINMIVNAREGSNSATTSATVTNDNMNAASKLADTYSIIIKSNTVLNQVIDELRLEPLGIDYEELYDKVTVSTVNNTAIMRITVKDQDVGLTAEIVQKIAEIAPAIIVEAVEAGSCKVVSDVMIGEKPVSPNVRRNTALAGLAGLLFCLIVITIRYLTRQKTVVDDEDIKNHLELAVLGVIPEIKEGK